MKMSTDKDLLQFVEPKSQQEKKRGLAVIFVCTMPLFALYFMVNFASYSYVLDVLIMTLFINPLDIPAGHCLLAATNYFDLPVSILGSEGHVCGGIDGRLRGRAGSGGNRTQ